jgi:hypothetical protein
MSLVMLHHAASVENESFTEALEGFRKVVELETEKGEWWAFDLAKRFAVLSIL